MRQRISMCSVNRAVPASSSNEDTMLSNALLLVSLPHISRIITVQLTGPSLLSTVVVQGPNLQQPYLDRSLTSIVD